MGERLKRLCQELYSKSVTPNINFPSEFMNMAPTINEAISGLTGVKTDVYPSLVRKSFTDLKVALIMSDFTSVLFHTGDEMEVFGANNPVKDFSEAFPKTVVLSRELVEQLEHREG